MVKMKQYADYADWRSDQSPGDRRLIDALQTLIEEVAPHLTRTVKWGQGCFADGDAHGSTSTSGTTTYSSASMKARRSTTLRICSKAKASTCGTSRFARPPTSIRRPSRR